MATTRKMSTVTIRADITLSYSAWEKIVRRAESVDQYVTDLLSRARKLEVHRLTDAEEKHEKQVRDAFLRGKILGKTAARR